jgi:hypothetical protein
MPTILFENHQPCNHKGCLSHISHPCEGCGRIGGEGVVYENISINCIGIDNKLHTCEPDKDTCKCGIKVKNKKPTKHDFINKFSCYECTY